MAFQLFFSGLDQDLLHEKIVELYGNFLALRVRILVVDALMQSRQLVVLLHCLGLH